MVDGTAETSARSFTYNHLGQLTQLEDDSGTRTFGYNAYGERETDSLVVDGDTHLITELRDDFGRSTGYAYAKNGSVLQSVSTAYGTDGRINSAGFMHGGEMKQFGYAPVSVEVLSDCKALTDDELARRVRKAFSFKPSDIVRELGLKNPIFSATTNYGHFGKADLPWEKPDQKKLDKLKS